MTFLESFWASNEHQNGIMGVSSEHQKGIKRHQESIKGESRGIKRASTGYMRESTEHQGQGRVQEIQMSVMWYRCYVPNSLDMVISMLGISWDLKINIMVSVNTALGPPLMNSEHQWGTYGGIRRYQTGKNRA